MPLDYARTDPVQHLEAESTDLPGPVVATMTAASVATHTCITEGLARWRARQDDEDAIR